MALMLFLNETIDQFAVANSVHCYEHVLRKDGHVLRRALDCELEDQRKEIGRRGHG